GINSQRLRETAGGIEAPVVLETHSFQLEVNSSYRACVSGRLQLEADAVIAHPSVSGGCLSLSCLAGSSSAAPFPGAAAWTASCTRGGSRTASGNPRRPAGLP